MEKCSNESTPDKARVRLGSCPGGGMCDTHTLSNIKNYWKVLIEKTYTRKKEMDEQEKKTQNL